ncbi:hypothetical protein OIDMADRAFT_47482 [Oidiodendron maius Zn]|uniref:Uncharacterized protein n=1 Tax=Oidiodendron maius (strain Zn) TaxID=913774 RepID=A0A0C3DZU2_OIDMZ|nr:hypothetical protein OIDMADRAFT_47482 [Oidiodendron maius Zn]
MQGRAREDDEEISGDVGSRHKYRVRQDLLPTLDNGPEGSTFYDGAIEAVNCEIWNRITSPRQGKASDGNVRAVDLEGALRKVRDEKYLMVKLDLPAKEMKEYGVGWGALWLIEPTNVPTMKLLPERPIYNDEHETSRHTSLQLEPTLHPKVPSTARQDKEVKEILDILKDPPLRQSQVVYPEFTLPIEAQDNEEDEEIEEIAAEELQIQGKRKSKDMQSIPKKKLKRSQCECSDNAKKCLALISSYDDKRQAAIILKEMFEQAIPVIPCLFHFDLLASAWGMRKCSAGLSYIKAFAAIFKEIGKTSDFYNAVISPHTWTYFDEDDDMINNLRRAGMSGALLHPVFDDLKITPKVPELAGSKVDDVQANSCLAGSYLRWIADNKNGICLAKI